jgi:hypothetical protein
MCTLTLFSTFFLTLFSKTQLLNLRRIQGLNCSRVVILIGMISTGLKLPDAILYRTVIFACCQP